MDRKRPLILVVDDENIYLELLAEILKGEYQLRTATNGTEGLQKALEEPRPDLVLLDWLLPDISGEVVCTQLKANPITAKIPILFLTINSSIDDEVRGFEAGAVDYIHKPISPPQLLARLRTHLQLRAVDEKLIEQKQQLEILLQARDEELKKTRDLALGWMETMVSGRKSGSQVSDFYINALKEEEIDPVHRPDIAKVLNQVRPAENQLTAAPDNQEVSQQLNKILSSEGFKNAERMRSLLQFIVTETLDGHAKSLKAFTIAIEVFQRDEKFDPQQDPLIRVQAGNLRKRLEQYYFTEGKNDAVRITVPKGSYSAKFDSAVDQEA